MNETAPRDAIAAVLAPSGSAVHDGLDGGGVVVYDFRDEVVAGLGDEWRMSRAEILAWLDQRRT